MREGTFITVEGIDGAGKTTAVEAVENRFEDVITTAEPSGLFTGQWVRELLSDRGSHPITDFFAFMADRNHHIEKQIQPSIAQGKLVVSDRYADSTRAYQSLLMDPYVDSETDEWIESVMCEWNYEPDLTIYLDIRPETAIERVSSGEKYERVSFLESVRERYLRLSEEFDERWCTIDAEGQSEEEVREAVAKIIEEEIK